MMPAHQYMVKAVDHGPAKLVKLSTYKKLKKTPITLCQLSSLIDSSKDILLNETRLKYML